MDFFIVGTSRSGSTLMRAMLAEHPRVAVLNESHWLPKMDELFGTASVPVDDLAGVVAKTYWDSGARVVDVNARLAGTTWDAVLAALRRRLGGCATVATWHEALVEEMFGTGAEAPLRGDKTPDYGYHMRLLQHLWPGTRFVHVVRNGLDTAASMARHSGMRLMVSAGHDNWCALSYDRLYKRYRRRPMPFAAFVASWRRRMRRIRAEAAAIAPGTYLEVRYENLVSRPQDTLAGVAGFLGIDDMDGWPATAAQLASPRPTRRHGIQSLWSLTAEDLWALNAVGGIDDLLWPVDAAAGDVRAGLAEGRRALEAGDAAAATQVGLSSLGTDIAQRDHALRLEGVRLVREGLLAAGNRRVARNWTDGASREPCE